MVGIGGPQSAGAGRVYLRDPGCDRWKTVIARLIPRARLIVVVPWDSKSVGWEVLTVRDAGLLARTVFVMPMRNEPLVSAAVWRRIQARYHELGLVLPDYDDTGMLFTLGSDGCLSGRRPLTEIGGKSTRSALLALTRPSDFRPAPDTSAG